MRSRLLSLVYLYLYCVVLGKKSILGSKEFEKFLQNTTKRQQTQELQFDLKYGCWRALRPRNLSFCWDCNLACTAWVYACTAMHSQGWQIICKIISVHSNRTHPVELATSLHSVFHHLWDLSDLLRSIKLTQTRVKSGWWNTLSLSEESSVQTIFGPFLGTVVKRKKLHLAFI